MSALRVAIVGCGKIAGGVLSGERPIRGNHAAACLEVGLVLAGCADPDEARRLSFARHWAVPSVHATAEALFADVRPDIAIVATTPNVHEEVCLAAVRAGVGGILCEKPFTRSSASAARVVRAVDEARVPLVVNFSRRWDASHQALAAKIASGGIGNVVAVWGNYVGTLRGNGSHLIDTLRMLVPGAWQVAWTSSLSPEQDDGPVDVVLRSDRGVFAHVLAVRDPGYFVFELEVFGTEGRASLRLQGNEIGIDRPKEFPDYPGYRYLRPGETLPEHTLPSSFGRALTELTSAVRERRMPTVPAEAYAASLALLDAIVDGARAQGR